MITEQLEVAPHSNTHTVNSIRLNSLPTLVVTHTYCTTRDYVDSFPPSLTGSVTLKHSCTWIQAKFILHPQSCTPPNPTPK